jgi:hypothetical protein
VLNTDDQLGSMNEVHPLQQSASPCNVVLRNLGFYLENRSQAFYLYITTHKHLLLTLPNNNLPPDCFVSCRLYEDAFVNC